MKLDSERLKLFIIDSELVTKEDLKKAEVKAGELGKYVGDVLVEEGKISEDDLRRLHAYIIGVPFVNLEGERIDPKVLGLIPEPIARNHNIISYRLEGDTLEVAMLDPEDLEAIDFIKKKAGFKVKPRLTSRASIINVLRQYQKSLEAEFGEIIKKDAGSIQTVA